MSIEEAQDMVLNWAINAERFDRMEFIKAYINTLSFSEVKGVDQLCKRAKRRKLDEVRGGEKGSVAPAIPVELVSTAECRVLAPEPEPEPEPAKTWWEPFKDSVVAVDCEFVFKILSTNGKKKKCQQILASVAIVDHNQETLYYKTVRRTTGSYHVTPTQIKLNGFRLGSLENGDATFEVIKKEVLALLQDKLIITVAGGGDFRALELDPIADYRTFDLQTHWYREVVNRTGQLVTEPMGLTEIFKIYFPGEVFQEGTHSPIEDAKATMRIFREIYPKVKTTDMESKCNLNPF